MILKCVWISVDSMKFLFILGDKRNFFSLEKMYGPICCKNLISCRNFLTQILKNWQKFNFYSLLWLECFLHLTAPAVWSVASICCILQLPSRSSFIYLRMKTFSKSEVSNILHKKGNAIFIWIFNAIFTWFHIYFSANKGKKTVSNLKL